MKRPSFLPSMKAIVLAMIFGFRLQFFFVLLLFEMNPTINDKTQPHLSRVPLDRRDELLRMRTTRNFAKSATVAPHLHGRPIPMPWGSESIFKTCWNAWVRLLKLTSPVELA